MPTLSVVIPTYNRRQVLAQALAHLDVQTLPADQFDVTVVDDGSADGTQAMVEAKIPQARYSLRYLRHDNRGPGFTQNRGILQTHGSLVLLLSDDALASPGCLAEHRRLHVANPDERVAVAGRMVQSPNLPQDAFLRRWDPWENEYLAQLVEIDYVYFWGCNVSFKRSFMLAHGMFLERRGAAMEDVELGYRLARHGLRLLYGKSAVSHHEHFETIDSACARAYERGLNFDLLYDRVDDPFLLARLRIVGPGKYAPKRGAFADQWRDPNPDLACRAATWEEWRTRPARRLALATIFNRVTVPWLWQPLVRNASRHRALAPLAASRIIYGCILYWINRGIKDMERRQSALAADVYSATSEPETSLTQSVPATGV